MTTMTRKKFNLRAIDGDSFRFSPRQLHFLVGAPVSGKSWYLVDTLRRFDRFFIFGKGRKCMILIRGAARDFFTNLEALKSKFETTLLFDSFFENFDAIQTAVDTHEYTVILADDLFLESSKDFTRLSRIIFHKLNHGYLCLIILVQTLACYSGRGLGTLAPYASSIRIHSSPSNYATVKSLSRRFQYSKRVSLLLLDELSSMIRAKQEKEVFDILLILPQHAIAIFNFQSLEVFNKKTTLLDLNRVLDLSMGDEGDDFYYLVPQKKLTLLGESKADRPTEQQENSKQSFVSIFPKQERDKVNQLIHFILSLEFLTIDFRKCELKSDGGLTCSLIDFARELSNSRRRVSPEIVHFVRKLEERGVSLPQVRLTVVFSVSFPKVLHLTFFRPF